MDRLYQLENLVSIGIATKNRWQDLQVTLAKIACAGLDELPVLIYDDNSVQICPFDYATLGLHHCQLMRDTESKGYIIGRNQLATLMKTKYYLSLDDDSYPVSGSIKAAIEFAETQENLFSLSFPIYNPEAAQYQNQSLSDKPYQVRPFIGCGHLLHIERFLAIGSYRKELVHQGEEMEIAARAFQKGWYCYHYPNFEIHHTASNTNRNWHRMDFYGSRNLVLWNDWFVPNRLKFLKQGRTLLSRVLHAVKVRRLGMIEGEIVGFKDIANYKQYRQNMSLALYKQWQKLPAC